MGQFETFDPALFGAMVAQAKADGVDTDCTHCFGDPEPMISDLAEAWHADLIVMGRRGRAGLTEFFLGSVSSYTVHHAPCSVHIVHQPTAKPQSNLRNKLEMSI